MNKIWGAAFGLLIAILALQLVILNELKKPKTFQLSSAQQAAPQATLAELQKQYTAIQKRYLALQKMTKQEWDAEGKRMGDDAKLRAPSLTDALAQNKQWAAELEEKINTLKNHKD